MAKIFKGAKKVVAPGQDLGMKLKMIPKTPPAEIPEEVTAAMPPFEVKDARWLGVNVTENGDINSTGLQMMAGIEFEEDATGTYFGLESQIFASDIQDMFTAGATSFEVDSYDYMVFKEDPYWDGFVAGVNSIPRRSAIAFVRGSLCGRIVDWEIEEHWYWYGEAGLLQLEITTQGNMLTVTVPPDYNVIAEGSSSKEVFILKLTPTVTTAYGHKLRTYDVSMSEEGFVAGVVDEFIFSEEEGTLGEEEVKLDPIYLIVIPYQRAM